MMTGESKQTTAADLDYVAICIAEQIVRVSLSARHAQRKKPGTGDLGPMLTRPLRNLAAELGIGEHVEALVDEALGAAA